MNTKEKNVIFLSLFLLGFLLGSCSKNPTEGITLKISPEIVRYSQMIEFYDAETHYPVNNAQVVFTGENKDKIIEMDGKKGFKIVDGKLAIGLQPAFSPTTESPIVVVMTAKADGYKDLTVQLSFSVDTEQKMVQYFMINLSETPKGVSLKNETLDLVNGTLENNYSLIIPKNTEIGQDMEIILPDGLTFFDENGNSLQGNNLEISVGNYSMSSNGVENYFPGGYGPHQYKKLDGNVENVYLAVDGFCSIEMFVNNSKVRYFSKPINVKIELNNDIPNSEENNTLNEGDSIFIASYNSDNELWSEENFCFAEMENGKLVINFESDHLSWFRWRRSSWYSYPWWYYCTSSARIQANMPNYPANEGDQFLIQLWTSNGQLVRTFVSDLYPNSSIYLGNLSYPVNYKLNVFLYSDYLNGIIVPASVLQFSTSACVTFNGSVTISQAPRNLFSLDITGICEDNPSFSFNPSFYIFYKEPAGVLYNYLAFVDKGKATTRKLQLNSTYDFKVIWAGVEYKTTHTVDKYNYTFKQDMGSYCDGL